MAKKRKPVKKKGTRRYRVGPDMVQTKRILHRYGAPKGKNPTQLLFRSKKAAKAYAKAHGAKKFSIRKLKKGR